MKRLTVLLWRSKSGVAALEYALIAALVAVMIIGGVARFGKSEAKVFTAVEKATKPAKLGL
jgi:Flp pilus assembly pilin Flp